MFLELMFVVVCLDHTILHIRWGTARTAKTGSLLGAQECVAGAGQSGRLPSLAPSPVSEAMCPSCFPGAKEAEAGQHKCPLVETCIKRTSNAS